MTLWSLVCWTRQTVSHVLSLWSRVNMKIRRALACKYVESVHRFWRQVSVIYFSGKMLFSYVIDLNIDRCSSLGFLKFNAQLLWWVSPGDVSSHSTDHQKYFRNNWLIPRYISNISCDPSLQACVHNQWSCSDVSRVPPLTPTPQQCSYQDLMTMWWLVTGHSLVSGVTLMILSTCPLTTARDKIFS